MSIYYLYVKQHNITKLKYFGFTTKKNPFKYKGSGLYWLRHLKKHGSNFSTIEIFGFDNHEHCRDFAIKFSIQNNITESDEWANLKSEDATNGGILGIVSRAKIGSANKGRHKGMSYEQIYGAEKAAELRQLRSEKTKGKNNKGPNNPMFGRQHSAELKDRYSRERSGANHFTYGWKWITNGIESLKVPPTHPLDQGWRYGRVIKRHI